MEGQTDAAVALVAGAAAAEAGQAEQDAQEAQAAIVEVAAVVEEQGAAVAMTVEMLAAELAQTRGVRIGTMRSKWATTTSGASRATW